MPPRRSARVADAERARANAPEPAELAELKAAALAPLPPPLSRRVFAALPVDSRARACCISRAWRAALAEPALWTRLDLSPAAGVTARVTGALLRAAAARAQPRGLEALDVSGVLNLHATALLNVVKANGRSLRHLRCAPPPSGR
jgi:hypothetical protein